MFRKFFLVCFVLFLFMSLYYVAKAEVIPQDGYYYVILTTSAFAPDCEPLRALRSYDTQHQAKIVTLDEIPAAVAGRPTWIELKSYFKNTVYPQPLNGFGAEYILLVGDTEFMPAVGFDSYLEGDIEGISDSSYTDFFGSGPEIAIGRICAHNSLDIQNYYQKILPAGSTGAIIPDGKDKALIYYAEGEGEGGEYFYSGDWLKEIWEPYIILDELFNTNAGWFNEGGLKSQIDTHSMLFNSGHGYGSGLRPMDGWVLNTDIKPFYFAFGCQSANFRNGPAPYEHPSEYFINQPGSYSSIIGTLKDHYHKTFQYPFLKAYFFYGYERIGDMMKWAQSQPGEDSSLMTLLGDPYLKIASNQFLNAPRISLGDSKKSYQRTYNLEMGSGEIDPVTFPIYSFNNAQWSISNISYSNPAISSFINFSKLTGSTNETIQVNFVNVANIPPENYTITFDIIDISNNLLIKQYSIALKVSNNNILTESDFINSGNEKKLPTGNYFLRNDLIIESGKILTIEPGTMLMSEYPPYKIIIQPGAKIKALGGVDNPIFFASPIENALPVLIEIQADNGQDYHGEFTYCSFREQIAGVNTPKLRFDNCTFIGLLSKDKSLFPNPITGELKNSVIARGDLSWPAESGYLSNLKVSYSLVPRAYKGEGKGIIWDYEDAELTRLNSTSLCINAGDPNDALDPDGTRKDIGAFYFSLTSAIKVPADYPTIQQALNAAQLSETNVVIVSPGTYQENIIIPSGMRLMGASEENRPILTQSADSGDFIKAGPNGMNYLMENFVITKQGILKTGRALFIDNVNLFVLRNVDFTGSQANNALVYSSGNLNTLFLDKVNFLNNTGNKELLHFERGTNYLLNWMRESSFENNSSNERLFYFSANAAGAGEIDMLLYKVLFANNTGGCLFLNNTSLASSAYSLILERPVFYNNNNASIQSNLAGATSIVSSTFYNNGKPMPLTIAVNNNSKLNINSSILWNNTITFNKSPTAILGINYTDINSIYPSTGTGNINFDPMFANISINDFQLLVGSPCINKGDPALTAPLNGGSRIDMGAYESLQDSTPPAVPVVNDEGAITTNKTTLSAIWAADDPETGITGYEYRITADSPVNGTIIKDWTSCSTNIVSVLNLNLYDEKTYYFGVKAQNGAGLWSDIGYSDGIKVDSTPPTTPVVTDAGTDTISTTTLTANWSSSDAESGIIEYQYAIGTSEGGTDVINWISAGTNTAIIQSDLTLILGTTYYFSVKAKNEAGLWSDIGYSDGILVIAPNQPPILEPIGNKTVNEGQTLNFTILASDPNTEDTLTYSADPLPRGASFDANSHSLTWKPDFTQSGIYAVTFTVRDPDGLTDSETVNITVINVPRADIIITALSTATTAIAPGSSFTVSNTVKNQGTASSGSFSVSFHLSTDTVYGGNDDIAFTANNTILSLNVGAISSKSITLTVPSTTAPGYYYICAYADVNSAIEEENENNNYFSTVSRIQVAPSDLIITSISGPPSAITGTAIRITNAVKNQEIGAVSGFYIGIYLSTDSIITTADNRIGTRYISGLTPGAINSVSSSLTILTNVAPGTYYIGAIADYANSHKESNETNNSLAGNQITVTSGTDLIMTAVSGPASAVKGTAINVYNAAKNQGAGTASGFYIGIYLSTDSIITTTDTRIGTRYISSLATGITNSGSSKSTIPTTISAGTYYIGAIADYANSQKESNENNNNLVGNIINIVSQ